MPYIRISLMKPLAGEQKEVIRINKELLSYFSEMKGYITGYVLRAAGGADDLGRVTVWEDEDDADRAASDQRTFTLRSDLHLKVRAGHTDRAFTAV